MYQPAPYPAEAPMIDQQPSKRSRLPLILFGARSNPDRTGWTREERAVQSGPVPKSSYDVYLGPRIPYDRDASEDTWRAALMDLMVWRFEAAIAPVGGVVVPHWDHYDAKHQQQLAVATRYVVTPDGHGGIALLTTGSERTFPLERAKTSLALYRAPRGRLEEIQRVQAPHREANVLEELQAIAPTVTELVTAIMSITGDAPRRTFPAACEVAREAAAAGRSDRWIRTYLETYGYVNTAGTIGRWHPKRLAEALDGAHR
jgi:hypothetical protein